MTLDEMTERGYTMTKRQIAELSKTLLNDYKNVLDSVRSELQGLYTKMAGLRPDEFYAFSIKFDRLAKLEKTIVAQYNSLAANIAGTVSETSRLAIVNNFYRQQYTLNWFASGVNVEMSFALVDPVAVEISVLGSQDVWARIARDTAKQAQYQPYLPRHGTLKNVLINNRQKEIQAIRQTITRSLINGDSYTKSSQALKSIMDTSASNTLRIIRTEGNRNMNAGHYQAAFDARKQGVEARRFIVSTLDTRTRQQSAQVDGRKENEEGQFTYPGGSLVTIPGNSGVAGWDINDRESTGTTIDGVEPELRRARNPVTGQTDIVTYRGFDVWAKENGLRYNKAGRLVKAS